MPTPACAEMNPGRSGAAAVLAGVALALFMPAQTAAATGSTVRSTTFMVSVIVDSDCMISNANALNFGHIGARLGLGSGLPFVRTDQATHLNVTCSKNTRYTLYMDRGSVPGSTVETRLMSGSSAGNGDRMQYQLYTDPSFSTLWGDGSSGSSSSVGGTGTGSVQTYTVYGRILDQSMPTPDLYSSIITASLTF